MSFILDTDLDVASTIPGKAGLYAGEYLVTRKFLRELVRLVTAGANVSALVQAAEAARMTLPEFDG